MKKYIATSIIILAMILTSSSVFAGPKEWRVMIENPSETNLVLRVYRMVKIDTATSKIVQTAESYTGLGADWQNDIKAIQDEKKQAVSKAKLIIVKTETIQEQ